MIFTKEDIQDTIRIDKIIEKIENVDAEYANSESDVLFNQQPFLISMLLGFRLDFKQDEIAGLTLLIFTIWEYFKDRESTKRVKVTKEQYEKIERKNLFMLKYFEGELGEVAKKEVVAADLNTLKSKALLARFFQMFEFQPPFVQIKAETKAILLIGMKSLIECFEENEKKFLHARSKKLKL